VAEPRALTLPPPTVLSPTPRGICAWMVACSFPVQTRSPMSGTPGRAHDLAVGICRHLHPVRPNELALRDPSPVRKDLTATGDGYELGNAGPVGDSVPASCVIKKEVSEQGYAHV